MLLVVRRGEEREGGRKGGRERKRGREGERREGGKKLAKKRKV